MGRYDEMIARQPDPYPEGRRSRPERVICRDCGANIRSGGMTTGVGSGASCQQCAGWRVDHGALFDERTIAELKQAQRRTA